MDKIIRISSVQGEHDRAGNKNLVDYHIPANSGVYNLRDSYIAVNVENNVKNSAVNNCTGHTKADDDHVRVVFCMYSESGLNATQTAASAGRYAGSSFVVPPTSAVLVKNAQMVSSLKGTIESLRRVDILRANQYSYVRSKGSLATDSNGIILTTESGANTCETRQPYAECVNVDPSTSSTVDGSPVGSIYRDHEIRIPLKEIFTFCQGVEQYDSAVYGSTHINLEMQFDKLAFGQSNINLKTTRYRGTSGESFLGEMEDFVNGATALVNVDRILTKNTYGLDSVELSPFYINQKIKLDNGGSVSDKVTTIKSIIIYDGQSPIKISPTNTIPYLTAPAVPANRGKLLIQTDGSYLDAVAAGANTQNIFLTTHDLGGADVHTLNILNVDLVAKLDRSGNTAPKQIQYTKFDLEEDSFDLTQNKILNRYYDLPENCDSIWILLTKNQTYATADATAAAGRSAIDKYRITIDNVEISNRDIEMHSQLHKDLIMKTMRNQGLPVGNMDEEFIQWNFNEGGGAGRIPSHIIGIPIPNMAKRQKLGIEITPIVGDTLQGFLNLYKHRAASI